MITYRMIEAFRAVIINGSISEAATFMYISQPAVSRLIKDLEEEIGFSLFDRRQGRIFTNDNALAFYEEVQRSYIGLEKISQSANFIQKQVTGELRIACMPAVGLSIMPKVIAHFKKIHPEIKIHIQVVRSSTVMQLLTSKLCDIGFVEASFTAPSLGEGPTYNLDCVCILPPKHPLTKKKWIEPKHLKNEPFISIGSDSRTRIKIDAVFKSKGIERNMHIEAPLMNMACSLVLEGCGVSIVDPFSSAIFEGQNLIVKPFKPVTTFSFRSLSSLRSSGSSLVQEFDKIFSKILTEISE